MRRWGFAGVVVAGLVAAAGLCAPLAAQEEAAPEWLRVNIVSVIPDRLDDYLELQLDEITPALQEAGVPWRSVWRTAEFGNSYELHFVTPIVSLSDYDTRGPIARVMPPDRYARLLDRLRRSTASRRSYAVEYRPELSVVSDEASGLFLARVVNLEIAPGRGADWTSFLERSLPSFQGAGVVFGVYQRLLGPGPVVWQLVENYQSFEELAQPTIIDRAFGEQAATVVSELAGVVTSIERTVLRYDAELSYSTVESR